MHWSILWFLEGLGRCSIFDFFSGSPEFELLVMKRYWA
jgi:hypothetical protein